jgi:hypothetical protein
MKRAKFEERGKLVVYLEEKDLQRLTKCAREHGRVVGEYVRNLILGHLELSRSVQQSKDTVQVEATAPEPAKGKIPEGIPRGNVHSLAEPAYKSHRHGCTCFLCNAARSAGLI